MKYFLILMLLVATSCVTSKHKKKEKMHASTEASQKEQTENATDLQTNISAASRDSAVQKTSFNNEKALSLVSQNLSLRNNGKCIDGGELRFLKFTDAQGNMTEVPVNDNTDVDFRTDAEIRKENTRLQEENAKLSTQNESLQNRLNEQSNTLKEIASEVLVTSSSVEKDKETDSFMSYVWTVIITIASVVLVQLYFKIKF